jgi:hypothetical protein
MSAIEREILEKFHQLEQDAKQRVMNLLEQEMTLESSEFDFDKWFRDIEALRQQINVNSTSSFDVVQLLRDIRDV